MVTTIASGDSQGLMPLQSELSRELIAAERPALGGVCAANTLDPAEHRHQN
jgi:hypothetical protein